jgi:2-polyprenyl-3-methyl-5-hydroxy-6-metoxy-1,4-benzoquinol methylase
MRRHGHEPKVIEPYFDGRFDTTGCLQTAPSFRTIIAQDVFEHVVNYLPILKALIGKLESGGKMIEHSPFARVPFNPKVRNERSTRVHLVDAHNLKKCMVALGMKLEKATVVNSKGSEVRTWTKT